MSGPGAGVPQGRVPVQARAIARVDAILDAAAAELAANGHPLNLTEVAARADVPIGSLYQYFPAQSSLVHALAQRHLETIGDAIVDDAASVGIDDEAIRAAIQRYLAVADDPLQIAIMRAIRADPDLRRLDRADTRRNVAVLMDALQAQGLAVSPADRDHTELVIELAGDLAISLSDRSAEDRTRLTNAFLASFGRRAT